MMRARTIQQWMAASAVALGVALMTAPAAAAVPGTITHQGRLFDAQGSR